MKEYQSLCHTMGRRGISRVRTSGPGGYFVTTIGLDEEMVRDYIRNQDKEDAHYDQLKLGM